MTDLEKLEDLKKLIAALVSSKKKFEKMSLKRAEMSFDSHTQKRIQAAEANLNWHAMEHDKLERDVHAAAVDCGLADPRSDYGTIEYNPSSFHCYRYQPRIPLCRQ